MIDNNQNERTAGNVGMGRMMSEVMQGAMAAGSSQHDAHKIAIGFAKIVLMKSFSDQSENEKTHQEIVDLFGRWNKGETTTGNNE